jgi:hypothetical protein
MVDARRFIRRITTIINEIADFVIRETLAVIAQKMITAKFSGPRVFDQKGQFIVLSQSKYLLIVKLSRT